MNSTHVVGNNVVHNKIEDDKERIIVLVVVAVDDEDEYV